MLKQSLFGLPQILSEIVKIAGLSHASPDICSYLSIEIRKKTHRQISETTLKRLFGFAAYRFSTAQYTLDTLACYIGFATWKKWQEYVQHHNSETRCEKSVSLDFSKLFYNSADAMWIFATEDMRFLEVNDSACRIYGYTRKEFLFMTILEIRPIEEYPLLFQTVSDAGDYSQHVPFQHILSNGEVVVVNVSSYSFHYGGICSRLVISKPITTGVHFDKKH